MTKLILTMGAAALALAACTEAPENETIAADPVVENTAQDNLVATNVQAEMLAMDDGTRNVVFIRAIRDAGLPCQGVSSSERVDDQQGLPTWRAYCDGGSGHLISITEDGTANIISRSGS